MNAELTFRSIFLTLYIVFIVIRYYYTIKAGGIELSMRGRLSEASKWEGELDVALRFVIVPFWIAPLILYVIYPDWMAWFTLSLLIWLRWIGVGVAIVTLTLLVWAYRTLGEQYSPDLRLREDHRLVTSGPYRWVRHPIYAAVIAFMIAVAAESANWLIVLSNIASIALL